MRTVQVSGAPFAGFCFCQDAPVHADLRWCGVSSFAKYIAVFLFLVSLAKWKRHIRFSVIEPVSILENNALSPSIVVE